MFGLSRKNLIKALVVSFALAIYQVWGLPIWASTITNMGAPLGVGEAAIGYLIVLIVAFVTSNWLTRNMDQHPE